MPCWVLVVEDDDAHRETVATILEDAGYLVHVAGDGAHGLRTIAEQGPPCLALVDLLLPAMSGYDFIRELDLLPEKPVIPVALMSGLSDPSELPQGNPEGAIPPAAILKKPYAVDELLRLVKDFCSPR